MLDGERLSVTLVTGYTSDHKDRLKMSKKVVENQFAYVKRHNYHYLEYKNNLAETYEPYWSKIKIINNWLDSNNGSSEDKWLVWLDDDMIIMDPSIKVEDLISKHAGAKSVIVAKDAIPWHGNPETSINTGILFVKNTQESRDFFNKVWDKRNESFTYTENDRLITTTLGKCKDQKCLHEQAAMADLLRYNQGRCVVVIDQRDKDNIGINTFIREKNYFSQRSNNPYYSDYRSDPPSSVASPGDFAAQCTGIPMLGKKNAFDNNAYSPLRLETAEIILNCVALLTDAEKQQLREEENSRNLSPLLQDIKEAFTSREFSKGGKLDIVINKILMQRKIRNSKQFLQNKIAKAKVDIEQLDSNNSDFENSKNAIIQALQTEWQQEYNALVEAFNQGISIKDNEGNSLDGIAALNEINNQKGILDTEDLKVFEVNYVYKGSTITISVDCSSYLNIINPTAEFKEKIVTLESIFKRQQKQPSELETASKIFNDIIPLGPLHTTGKERLKTIKSILLSLQPIEFDVQGNISQPIIIPSNISTKIDASIDSSKVISLLSQLLVAEQKQLETIEKIAQKLAQNKIPQLINGNDPEKIDINVLNLEVKNINILDSFSQENIKDTEINQLWFREFYKDALQQQLNIKTQAYKKEQINKTLQDNSLTSTGKEPIFHGDTKITTMLNKDATKLSSQLKADIHTIIAKINNSQDLNDLLNNINEFIENNKIIMSDLQKELISTAITDRSIKFLNEPTLTAKQLFTLLPAIQKIISSGLLDHHSIDIIITKQNQEIKNKGKGR